MKTTRLAVFVLGLSMASTLPAQMEQPQEDVSDRGVARISLLNGDVSVKRGDSGDWIAAAVNAPVLVGDAVFAGPGSRAEVQFDAANMMRIGSESELRMGELADGRYLVQMARGVATFRVLRDSNAEVEISTPNASLRPKGRGIYRIEIQEDGTTLLTVRAGQAEVYSPRGSQGLSAGRTMMLRGTAEDPEFQLIAATQPDDWDRWNDHRDREMESSQSYQYVGQGVYGAEDLDGYGSWGQDPTYGAVWYPRVAADWAPYREGRWVWMDYYGWTWVSYDPWGWAPYHYGRWFYAGGRGWCWWPGGRGRHHWSPALVAFFGVGGGGVSVGFGRVGWVPLGPHEPFHRWWGGGRYRGGNTVVVNNINIYNTYRNARVHNGVMAMQSSDFGRGRGGHLVSLRGDDLQRAQFVRGQAPVVPTRDSLRMADRGVRLQNLPRNDLSSQRFFSHRQPMTGQRSSFADQQRGMEQRLGGPRWGAGNSNFPANGGGWRRMGDNPGGRPSEVTGGPAWSGSRTDGGNWRRTGNPALGSGPQQRPAENGWHRMGDANHGDRTPGSGQPEAGRVNNGGGWRRNDNGMPSRDWQRNDNRPETGGSGSNADGGRRWIGSGREPVRMNPPMMHQRNDTPRASSPMGGGAPSGGWNRPSSNAPRMAPSGGGGRGWGGGGGSPRMAPGGGGGNHGGGGGGSRPSGGGHGGRR